MTGRGASAGAAPGRRRVILGAALVAAAGLMFALAGMGIKMAEESLSSFEVLFWRNVLSLAILTPWVLWHWPRSMRPAHRGLMAMRGVALVAALLCYYHAVSVLPLAEAVLLNFSAPIFVPVLGFLLFRFALDGRVLAAVLIGFAGVALILKPGTEFFQPAALIGAASGVLGGLSAVAIWRMPTDENPIRIAVYFALIGILVTLTPVLMNPTLPPAEAWPGLIMLGVFSTAAHVLFAKGSLIAPTDRVGTFIYTAVVFAAVFGWLFWDEGVDWLMAGGAVLIVAAGVIAIRAGRPGRERCRRRRNGQPASAPGLVRISHHGHGLRRIRSARSGPKSVAERLRPATPRAGVWVRPEGRRCPADSAAQTMTAMPPLTFSGSGNASAR